MSNTKSVAATKPQPTVKAPAIKVKATAKAAPAIKAEVKTVKTPKVKAPSINIGVKTGMRVMAYQDHTFEVNDQPNRRLTNDELAADWRAEFPNSRAVQHGRITGEMVAAVRSLYNRGTGGHGTPGERHESVAYAIVNGKRTPVLTKAESAEPKPVAAKTPAPAKTVAKTAAA